MMPRFSNHLGFQDAAKINEKSKLERFDFLCDFRMILIRSWFRFFSSMFPHILSGVFLFWQRSLPPSSLLASSSHNTTQQHNTTQHNTQHTTHNTQHTTHNTQHTTHNTQHITHNALKKDRKSTRQNPSHGRTPRMPPSP
jgi:ABC-type nickel/cobalt efflux system permease component RcnA